ncbi:MAG TPA: hypothetical protein VNS52_17900 [Gemmatimonadaceae bacterium]|nr:hypothetical protein [Gemmatimonadaceae bacterium]
MHTRSAVSVASLLLIASGCTDRSLPSAPRRAAGPSATVYTATVSGPVTLSGLVGSTQNIAFGINAAGIVSGTSGGHTVVWTTGTGVAPSSTAPITVDYGLGYDINAAGQIAGEYASQAALWTPDGSGGYVRTDIGAQLPSPVFSDAWAVNDGGKVVGYFRTIENAVAVDKCFLWTPNVANGTVGTVSIPSSDFGGGFCVANDINSAGTIAGASNLPSGGSHAFVWDGGASLTDLTPGGDPSYGTAINDGGQVAGWRVASPTLGGVTNAAVWTPTGPSSWSVQDLGTFGHDESQAADINDAGFVVAFGRNNTTTVDDAFFWQNGVATPLPGITGYTTAPTGALNNLTNTGVVLIVGASTNTVTADRIALRWAVTLTPVTPQGCIADLVALVGQMQTDGTLRTGEAKSLLAKLDATTRQIDQGRTTPATNLLYAFINEVNALVASGRLTAAQAQPLIDGARCAIDAL